MVIPETENHCVYGAIGHEGVPLEGVIEFLIHIGTVGVGERLFRQFADNPRDLLHPSRNILLHTAREDDIWLNNMPLQCDSTGATPYSVCVNVITNLSLLHNSAVNASGNRSGEGLYILHVKNFGKLHNFVIHIQKMLLG